MRGKPLSAIIVLAITVMMNSYVLAASDTLKQTNDNKTKLETKVDQLNTQINSVIDDINKNKDNMNKIARDIKNTQVKLDKIERDSKTQDDLFNKRVRAMYISGSDGYFQVLLSSSDINDFISRVNTISRVMNFDRSIIAELKRNKEIVSEKKQNLISEKNKLQALRVKNENTLAKLNSDISQQKKLLAKASQKEQELIAERNAISAIKPKEVAFSPSNGGNTLSRGGSISSAKVFNMQATAYSNDGITASGASTRKGVIAVDPRVIPLGSRVYIEGYGYAIAADTGGAIKGNIIDLFFPSESDCRNWGRRSVNVYILN